MQKQPSCHNAASFGAPHPMHPRMLLVFDSHCCRWEQDLLRSRRCLPLALFHLGSASCPCAVGGQAYWEWGWGWFGLQRLQGQAAGASLDAHDPTCNSCRSVNWKQQPCSSRTHRQNMEPGWSPLESDSNPYLQVDFLQPTFITAVVTQGGDQARGFVARYRLAYSKDGVHFQNYTQAGSSTAASLPAQVQTASSSATAPALQVSACPFPPPGERLVPCSPSVPSTVFLFWAGGVTELPRRWSGGHHRPSSQSSS